MDIHKGQNEPRPNKVVAHPTPKEDVQPCGRKNRIYSFFDL